ncbi:MAG: DUF2254 domain-containing protein [Waddliaceae bacterium]
MAFTHFHRKDTLLSNDWGINQTGIQDLFSSISGAIMAAMTTILSITLLIFTVLAGQYGAYILRSFKIRAFSKFVLGWFSGTYIYLIYCIYKMTIGNEGSPIPQISITLGIIFTFVTIFLLILYVHFLVRQIQAGTVISQIADELCESIKSMKPYNKAPPKEETLFLPEEIDFPKQEITLNRSGYLQSIDKQSLYDIADKIDMVLKILYRQGDFIFTGSSVVVVYSKKKLNEDIISTIRSKFILGEKRVPLEDLECNLLNLLEMALRALSPGINDLMVANNCINYISESIARLTSRQFPNTRHYNDKNKLLVISKEFSFEAYVSAAFNPLRQYAEDHCSVSIRLMENLIAIAKLAKDKWQKEVIACHFYAIFNAASQKHGNTVDLSAIEKREKIFASLS